MIQPNSRHARIDITKTTDQTRQAQSMSVKTVLFSGWKLFEKIRFPPQQHKTRHHNGVPCLQTFPYEGRVTLTMAGLLTLRVLANRFDLPGNMNLPVILLRTDAFRLQLRGQCWVYTSFPFSPQNCLGHQRLILLLSYL